MSYILGIDLETDGLDVATCNVLEVGAVLWDIQRKRVVTLVDDLVDGEFEVPPEISELTGIEYEYILKIGKPRNEVIRDVLSLVAYSSALIAHNGNAFDRPVFMRFLGEQLYEGFEQAPWIDTLIDLPYPPETMSRKLAHLAADHGFLLDGAHRAVFDVVGMLRIASNYDLESIIEQAKSPMVQIMAYVSYEDRNLAKEQGFIWNPQRRAWIKSVRECNLPKEVGHGFAVARLDTGAVIK